MINPVVLAVINREVWDRDARQIALTNAWQLGAQTADEARLIARRAIASHRIAERRYYKYHGYPTDTVPDPSAGRDTRRPEFRRWTVGAGMPWEFEDSTDDDDPADRLTALDPADRELLVAFFGYRTERDAAAGLKIAKTTLRRRVAKALARARAIFEVDQPAS
ncbi:hypothetical protein ACFV4N_23855 [Actinosynnema sp. NPDC059797]